jgi:hypothetical protein
MMPMSVMGLVLLSYVLVVGPIDYLLLGLLRLRKFTWVVFPVVTLGFAMFTLMLSERYMSTDDQRRSAVFLDVVEGGRIARENRVELLLTSSHGRVERKVNHALFTPLEGTFGENAAYQQFYQSNVGRDFDYTIDSMLKAPHIEGVVPDRYTVLQNVHKWTPQLNRLLAIDPQSYAVKFDWDSIAAADFAAENRQALVAKLKKAFGDEVSAHAIDGLTMISLCGEVYDTPRVAGPEWNYFYANQRRMRAVPGTKAYIVTNEEPPVLPSFFHEVCAAPQRGIFTLVSQIAPTGGDNFEDFAVFDATDTTQWLLVVGVRDGNDLLFYRKRYPKQP